MRSVDLSDPEHITEV